MPSIKCPDCGLVNFADAQACRRCKKALGAAAEATAPAVSVDAQAAVAVSPSGEGPQILGRVTTKHGFKDLFVIVAEDSMAGRPEGLHYTGVDNRLERFPFGCSADLQGPPWLQA